MRQNGRLIDKIILSLCFIFLLVDTLNGVLLRNDFPISIGQVFKFPIIALMILRLVSHNLKYFAVSLLMIVMFVFHGYINFLVSQTLQYFVEEMIFAFKLMFIFVSYLYFRGLIENEYLGIEKISRRILIFSFWVVAFNLIIGIMGFGYAQYYGNIGTRGFFYAGNEVSGLMMVLFAFILFIIWNEKGSKLYFLAAIFLIVLSLFKATKVAIIGTIFLIVILPLLSERNRIRYLTRLKIGIASLGILLIPVLSYLVYLGIESSGLLDRFLYFFAHRDFLSFILSDRNIDTAIGLNRFSENYNFLEKLFGIGLGRFSEFFENRHSVEIDFFDLFFYYGLIGSLVISLFWSYLLLNSFRLVFKQDNYYAPMILAINLILLFVSITAGHIIYSGLAGLFIGITNSMLYLKSSRD